MDIPTQPPLALERADAYGVEEEPERCEHRPMSCVRSTLSAISKPRFHRFVASTGRRVQSFLSQIAKDGVACELFVLDGTAAA
jgi:hypothetical protein